MYKVMQSKDNTFIPAIYAYSDVVLNKGEFETMLEAIEYVKLWLGPYNPGDYYIWLTGHTYHYSGYGDYVVILSQKGESQ
jgi:hypothetical protein